MEALIDFLEICKAYNNLGWAIQEQLDDTLDGRDLSKCNPDALRMILEWLRSIDLGQRFVDDLHTNIEDLIDSIELDLQDRKKF